MNVADLLGRRLADRYELLRELGRGGMGSVFLARDTLLEREVAIKLLTSVSASDAEGRFRREARIVARMDHPSIVGIHDLGVHDGSPFLVMPYVEGVSVRTLVSEHRLTVDDVLLIGIQVAQALAYSHERDVIHRDVKPENIIVTRRDGEPPRVRITDFGIALVTEGDRVTRAGALIGTAAYLSPEQAQGLTLDGRSDLYSLGTVLHECLAGEPPFTGHVQGVLYRIVHEAAPSLRALGATVAEEVEALVLRCLEKDPARRFQDGSELADALTAVRLQLDQAERERRLGGEAPARRAFARPATAAFVGRRHEMHELQARLAAAEAGESQLVLVAGEGGIGKTRLLEELAGLAKAREVQVLHGRFVERSAALPFHGFCEIVQEHFRHRRDGGPTPDLSDLAPELIYLFPVLAEIEELRPDASTDLRLAALREGPRPDPTHLHELLARTLLRLAAGRPLVLVLEDLHAADVSIDALLYVFRRVAPTPILLAGTYLASELDRAHPLTRFLETLSGERRFLPLVLQPLSLDEHRQLLGGLTAGAPLSSRVVEQLYIATDGNPFFIRELVRSLLDAGGFVRDETGVFNLSGEMEIATHALPETVQQAVERRVDRLPDRLRGVLAVGAVLGRSFEYRELEAVSASPDVDEAVAQLVRRGFLEEKREGGRERLKFASGVVRDVIYAALPRRQRRTVHRRYAELLEERNAGRLERVFPQLVEHFTQAEVGDKVVAYGLQLAERKLAALAAEDARSAAATVLSFLDDAGESETERAAEVRLVLAAAHRLGGNVDAALGELERAAKLFHRVMLADRWLAAAAEAAETAWRGRRTEAARSWTERGLEVARVLGEPRSLVRLLSIAATLANLRGEYDLARSLAEEADRLQPAAAGGDEPVPRGGRLVVGLPAAVQAVHPGQAQLAEEDEVLANVFETLVTVDADGVLTPLLAAGWRMDPDGASVEIELRPEVRLHDGSALDAVAVKRALEGGMRRVVGALPAPFVGIRGAAELAAGRADEASGIEVLGPHRLRIVLAEPLPIFPALLADPWTAIACEVTDPDGTPRLVGSGPFVLRSLTGDSVVLERHEGYWQRQPAHLGSIEFRTWLSAGEMASGLRSGRLDLVRDLQPADLEEILRDRHLRAGLVEAAKKNTYFVIFNSSTAHGHISALRMAMCGVVRTHDLVRATLGRFAEPAEGLLPPGILGHDPGRRRRPIAAQDAAELLRAIDLPLPRVLRAGVHPVFQDRYASLLEALFKVWADIGIRVSVETPNMATFMAQTRKPNPDLDLVLGRWIADYEDPDNFAFGLFHSRRGRFRSFHSSATLDALIDRARGTDHAPTRVTLYRKFEDLLIEDSFLLPLFHEVDYRVAGPRVHGLRLASTAPYVNYSGIGKTEPQTGVRRNARGGVLEVAIPARLETLDPLVFLSAHWDVMPAIFETLTRPTDSARMVPWLAAEITAEDGGMRYRIRLREDVRFHDGRRLHARDVRYSFERLLLDPRSGGRWMLAQVRGASELLHGELDELAGFDIVSAHEFVIELDEPIAFFPSLLAAVPIVPDGSTRFVGSWDEGCVGTGPFRVRRFEPGRRVELEPSPYYWRPTFPRSDGLVFRFGVGPEEIRSGFADGALALAWNLEPAAVEALRHDPAVQYREAPSLSTYFLALNRHCGPLADRDNRLRVAQAIDAAGLLGALGRVAVAANGLIPPGLLGHEGARTRTRTSTTLAGAELPPLELTAITVSVYDDAYAAVTARLLDGLAEAGIHVRLLPEKHDDPGARSRDDVDLLLTRWLADYPDADSFVYGILHRPEGDLAAMCGGPDLDALVERGRVELAPEVRDGIYREVEALLDREILIVPIFHAQAYRFARPEVRGFEVGLSDPVLAYERLWLDRSEAE